MESEKPTREELLQFVSEATGWAGSFTAQTGRTMPWTEARKSRSRRVYNEGKRLLSEAGLPGRYE